MNEWRRCILHRLRFARIRDVRRALLLVLAASTPARADLFGLVDTGELHTSSDGGVNWSVRSTLPVHDAIGLAAGATASHLFLATRSGGFFVSTDAGVSWAGTGAVPASDVCAMTLRADGAVLLLTSTGTVWESEDGGSSFIALATLPAPDYVSLTRDESEALYALTGTGDVARSPDGGFSWTPVASIPVSDAVEIVGADDLWLITGTGALSTSIDGGVSWTTISTLSQVGVTGMAIGPGGTLYATTGAGEVAGSFDAGGSWTWVGTMNQLNVMALATDELLLSVPAADPPAALRISVGWPYPSPARGDDAEIRIPIVLPASAEVRVDLLDVGGRFVRGRRAASLGEGRHTIRWRPGALEPGVYFVRVRDERGQSSSRRWLVLR